MGEAGHTCAESGAVHFPNTRAPCFATLPVVRGVVNYSACFARFHGRFGLLGSPFDLRTLPVLIPWFEKPIALRSPQEFDSIHLCQSRRRHVSCGCDVFNIPGSRICWVGQISREVYAKHSYWGRYQQIVVR